MKENLIAFLSLLLICGFTGCAGVKNSMRPSTKTSSWNPVEALTGSKKKEAEEAEAVTVTAIWKDSTFEKPGSPAVKGFGGRFFFYDKDSNPVKAEGELIVYGFDDSKEDESKKGPDKKFVFRESEFQSHYSDSGLGHSYSVWIPWEKAGGTRKMITLIPVFRRSDGTIMKCGQSTSVLPGIEPVETVADTGLPYKYLGASSALVGQGGTQSASPRPSSDPGVQQAGFDGPETTRPGIKTSTINVPRNMAQRIAAASNQPHEAPEIQGYSETRFQVPRSNRDRRLDRTANWGPADSVRDNTSSQSSVVEQPESSASSPVSAARKAFGVPGRFN